MRTIKAGYSINGSLEKYNQLLSEEGYNELLNQQLDDNFYDEDMFCAWVKEEALVQQVLNDSQGTFDRYYTWAYEKITELFLADNTVEYYSDDNPFSTVEEDEKLEKAEILDDFDEFVFNTVTYYEM